YSPVDSTWEDVVTTIASNILAFFIVAYLAGYLAEKTARIERELHEKDIDFDRLEHLNRQIVDNIPTGIMTIDEAGRVTSFNRAAVDITGHTLRDVYYKSMNEIFPALSGLLDDVSTTDLSVERECETKSGLSISLGLVLSPGQGEDMANVVIFQDLTQMKRLEEELRRDDRLKALGELSAAIAHEIRNPLASISGSVQVLREELSADALTGDRRHLMEIVVRETERLNALITDFLLFAKPADGKTESFDVAEVIGETVKVFSNSPEAAGIDIRTLPEPEDKDDIQSAFVDGNRRQLSQVFWNLLLNASISMKDLNSGKIEGSSKLTVSKKTIRGGGEVALEGSIEIAITDSGKGIAPENIERIFDPFFSTRELGTGLGLSLAHRIIESHGGRIEVTSELGTGTTFKVILPLRVEHP
ncbi:MAG: PAS domain S-box protein, partial [Deltaproteobacteria bacterium]|nr:PAS domain S-box protein [Deltaproteobacteria bacterium]